jgi:hypothetical protein
VALSVPDTPVEVPGAIQDCDQVLELGLVFEAAVLGGEMFHPFQPIETPPGAFEACDPVALQIDVHGARVREDRWSEDVGVAWTSGHGSHPPRLGDE